MHKRHKNSTNIGKHNKGSMNIGLDNNGVGNIGNINIGRDNIGALSIGLLNIGFYNHGKINVGSGNFGIGNIGSNNIGFFNIGIKNFGIFNTNGFQFDDIDITSDKEIKNLDKKIFTFNEPTDWTFEKLMTSIDFDMLFKEIDSVHRTVSKKTFNVFERIPNFDEALMSKILIKVYGYYDVEDKPHWWIRP